MNELKKSTDSKMTVTKYEDLDKHFHSAMQVVDDIVLKYTKLTQADLDEINNKKLDKRFTAEEALALKICDEVL